MRKTVRVNLLAGLFLCALVVRAQAPDLQAPRYDLLLKGGHIIDPANGLDAKMDVGVSFGRIAAVEKDIPANQAGEVVDVSGLYVTPGLIDIHYHVGHGGAPLIGSRLSPQITKSCPRLRWRQPILARNLFRTEFQRTWPCSLA